MAAMVTNLSWWLWSGKKQESANKLSGASSLNSSLDVTIGGSREVENKKISTGNRVKMPSKRVKQKWHSREERRIDREYDAVLVPSDGGCCLSESDSDDSDWSIGWMEPHAPDFHSSDDEFDASFAVLVPCYSQHGRKRRVDSPTTPAIGYSSERNAFLEQWLSSLQTS